MLTKLQNNCFLSNYRLLHLYPTYWRMIYEPVGRKQLFPGTSNITYLVTVTVLV